ncbi:hypothetical protein CAI21_11095 [Alkalilimnicola ehrlichii]|uniref:TonB-dependent receptor-like beta-barrel domain-containing protein n=1 Tax=Alkalilimnicola ehrlichii TaxID=351052 RepID=A0A3E0WZW1_9GAMM|nr:hypothetical protein CAI21_11095 [Alkalilimnicola ehrlichii]RFA38627.1 hypothetical protein CAL65_04645 [Alkalilimnicola ehrlichii]
MEVGIKADWFGGRLSANLAVYEITRKNERVRDPNDTQRSIQIGEFRSRGGEIDLVGELTPNWRLLVGVGYIDAEVTEDSDPDNIGKRPSNIPRYSGHLWTRYDFVDTGLGLGGGLNYVGKRETFDESVVLPAYTVFDLAAYYKLGALDLALNISNLTDERYFVGGFNDRMIFPGAPRTLSLTANYAF